MLAAHAPCILLKVPAGNKFATHDHHLRRHKKIGPLRKTSRHQDEALHVSV